MRMNNYNSGGTTHLITTILNSTHTSDAYKIVVFMEAESFDGNQENCYLEFSTDRGLSWSPFVSYVDINDQVSREAVIVSTGLKKDNIIVRWTFESNGKYDYCHLIGLIVEEIFVS